MRTSMCWAIRERCHEKIQGLIKTGFDLSERDGRDFTPLHWACMIGDRELAVQFLDNGADVNARARLGMTPLHVAANKGYLELVRLLLDRGAVVNPCTTGRAETPLYYALVNYHATVAQLLIENGAHLE